MRRNWGGVEGGFDIISRAFTFSIQKKIIPKKRMTGMRIQLLAKAITENSNAQTRDRGRPTMRVRMR